MITQEMSDKHYTNAETLLKQFRNIQLCVNIRSFENNTLNDPISTDNKNMMEIICRALSYMQESGYQNNRKYKILYYAYLSPEPYTNDEIMEFLEIDNVRTLQRQRKDAIDFFSNLLWGGSSIKNTAWNNLRYRIASRLPLSSIKRLISEFFPNYVLIKKTDKKKYQRYRQNGIFYAGLSAKHFWQTGNTIENRQVTCPKCKHKMDFENISPEENKLDKTINCPICKARMLLTTTVIFEEESYE